MRDPSSYHVGRTEGRYLATYDREGGLEQSRPPVAGNVARETDIARTLSGLREGES